MKKIIITLSDETYFKLKNITKDDSSIYPEGISIPEFIRDIIEDKLWVE